MVMLLATPSISGQYLSNPRPPRKPFSVPSPPGGSPVRHTPVQAQPCRHRVGSLRLEMGTRAQPSSHFTRHNLDSTK